jgi:hypothetical protein
MESQNTDNQNGIKLVSMSCVNEAADLNETNMTSHHHNQSATVIPVTSNSTQSAGEQIRPGGIKEFIAQTTMIGNVIAAAASQKNSSEPLPFTDYSLFDETYGLNLP